MKVEAQGGCGGFDSTSRCLPNFIPGIWGEVWREIRNFGGIYVLHPSAAHALTTRVWPSGMYTIHTKYQKQIIRCRRKEVALPKIFAESVNCQASTTFTQHLFGVGHLQSHHARTLKGIYDKFPICMGPYLSHFGSIKHHFCSGQIVINSRKSKWYSILEQARAIT